MEKACERWNEGERNHKTQKPLASHILVTSPTTLLKEVRAAGVGDGSSPTNTRTRGQTQGAGQGGSKGTRWQDFRPLFLSSQSEQQRDT